MIDSAKQEMVKLLREYTSASLDNTRGKYTVV
jgi:hypothetical protein